MKGIVAGLALVSGLAGLAGCAETTTSSSNGASCTYLQGEAQEFLDQASDSGDPVAELDGGTDWVLRELQTECPADFAQLRARLTADALQFAGGTANSGSTAVDGSIPWDSAAAHAGERATVCGPLVNDGTSRDDVFLNLGRGYPDLDRFTIVLWDVGGIEEIPKGAKVCATGPITLYEGVAQIEADLGNVKVDLP